MNYKINNLVFQGGGVLGIAYLGVLNYLYNNGILQRMKRVGGTSAGAITACLASFSLPFDEMKKIADTLDYKKITQRGESSDFEKIPAVVRKEIARIFGDINCIYRLITNYGWYSSEYFYEWIKEQIASQFNSSKKLPPYTFKDFKNSYIHKKQRPFLDLYVMGTDISTNSSKVFCFETTPDMEVATAIRISMSIPLFFESIKFDKNITPKKSVPYVFSDGGIMRNYPINLFDSHYFMDKIVNGVNIQTLGVRFKSKTKYTEINSFIDYIENLIKSFMKIQQDMYNNNPEDKLRSIEIDTKDISFIDFNISPNDEKYNFLYQQGYRATKDYFENMYPESLYRYDLYNGA
ncbi:patatin-like phospholipase family protein [Paramaledivibacter caminithermalis]|uniref:NTE family protein n=1 Tax=Paramaledivibacter caminithermalis (strain DSM 15212 / CIP 107654 / DViRD3) TaxID=1121301 RepID=A0A1M6KKQ5_PARC5|nr:patatin-like phospholipase family protein [Paramaledivibacter caminithermalis]SHJ59542.1 NTE family protein [Paramaledivibacter caminithermalis DSM 15212]